MPQIKEVDSLAKRYKPAQEPSTIQHRTVRNQLVTPDTRQQDKFIVHQHTDIRKALVAEEQAYQMMTLSNRQFEVQGQMHTKTSDRNSQVYRQPFQHNLIRETEKNTLFNRALIGQNNRIVYNRNMIKCDDAFIYHTGSPAQGNTIAYCSNAPNVVVYDKPQPYMLQPRGAENYHRLQNQYDELDERHLLMEKERLQAARALQTRLSMRHLKVLPTVIEPPPTITQYRRDWGTHNCNSKSYIC